MDLSNLKTVLADQASYRHKQIHEAIYSNFISDWEEATNLSKDLRAKLAAEVPLAILAEIVADKQTEKAAITLNDGQVIETVLIKNTDGRNTVCVSSQVGCALNCAFCATGQGGFKRNLTTDEIVEQVLLFARKLKKIEERVDNIVFMGMGEPFLNWENVASAIKLFNADDGFNIAARSISISTCGITSGIYNLIKFPLQVNLALSLHAPKDSLRQELMPIARKYPLKQLWEALIDYMGEKNRKVMIEYLMIDGINDMPVLAEKLADMLEELPKNLVMVNLIAYNPTAGSKFKTSSEKAIFEFKRILGKRGFEAVIRESLGGEVDGACGQLAGRK